jgi:rfaE bifunctional protein nucleotidyltransferase chain/domain
MAFEFHTEQKIVADAALTRLLARWRFEGQRVVFTNGCFDVLHLGHVDYLERARAHGTVLLVGLNADASVRRLKGPNRPVNPEYARARVLAALLVVDAVVIFGHEPSHDDTPLALIRQVRPQVLAKGADYTVETVVGAPDVLGWGGRVELIPVVNGYSTTSILAANSEQ